MEKIDYNSGMPLYLQLKDIIKKQIMAGHYPPGVKIPTEEEYCKKYDISRITVRQAINYLVQEKLLIRKQGKGTFVASAKMKKHLPKLYSFTEDMIAEGRTPDSIIMNSSVIDADEEIAGILELPERNKKVFRLCRVRRADEVPILYETTYIPDYLCPELGRFDFSQVSLYKVLQLEYELIFKYAEERYEASLLNKETAVILETAMNDPAFNIYRVAFLEDSRPYELTYATGKGDSLSFTVTLVPETKIKRNY